MNFRGALLRRMQDFGNQSEGELWLFHFNPTKRLHIRAFGRDHARSLARASYCEEFFIFNVGDFTLGGGFQAGHSMDNDIAVAEHVAADMRGEFRNCFRGRAHDIFRSVGPIVQRAHRKWRTQT